MVGYPESAGIKLPRALDALTPDHENGREWNYTVLRGVLGLLSLDVCRQDRHAEPVAGGRTVAGMVEQPRG